MCINQKREESNGGDQPSSNTINIQNDIFKAGFFSPFLNYRMNFMAKKFHFVRKINVPLMRFILFFSVKFRSK